MKKKVLIVDDSAFMRKLIRDFVSESPDLMVVGTARNGQEAIDKVKQLHPDVVTMDVEMPVMNGLEALKSLMEDHPVPVVMLSSTTTVGAENTMVAMEYGAFDFVSKPSGTISLDLYKVKDELLEKLVSASTTSVDKLVKSRNQMVPSPKMVKDTRKSTKYNQPKQKLICIGTSTGGPRALQEVLTNLPEAIQAPILVVQHMPAGFTKSLANRLNSLSEISVKEAEDGELLRNGVAYIAPGGYHMMVKQLSSSYCISLTNKIAPRNGHRPSVDVMFESVSELGEFEKMAVVMTGMGTDGAKGLIKLKEYGRVKAVAEAEETCIVYGMPKACVATNLVDERVPLQQISEIIQDFVS
nr:chemotaxis response regulator protein-glutamate methylesterase [Bacillus coahuilensis]